MNKRKKMAIIKHRRKRKKLELRRKALNLASGAANKPTIKAAVKKEIEIPKPVKALADILKPKEAAPAKKPAVKKPEPVKAEAAEKAEKTKKAPAKKKASPASGSTTSAKAAAPKKAVSRKKKPESAEGG